MLLVCRINGGLINEEPDADGNETITLVGTTLWFSTGNEVGSGIGSVPLCYLLRLVNLTTMHKQLVIHDPTMFVRKFNISNMVTHGVFKVRERSERNPCSPCGPGVSTVSL
jgi:hypothetical protein